jgi:MFS family permease
MIAIQRTASRLSRSAAERLQIFSWIALAPALGGLVGPLLTGALVDYAGFRPAFLALILLPLLSLVFIRRVPREVIPAFAPPTDARTSALDLLRLPLLRRILLINLLVVACWDVHSFALPILGHERGFSATLIGAVFASYSMASLLVRGLLPALARQLPQALLPALGLGLIGLIFALYPLLTQAWMLMLAAAAFGLVLGVVQPTIMTILHDCAPPRRQGETLALRSMFNQLAMTLLPLLYGAVGVVMGAAFMFWMMALGLFAGAWQASYFFRFPTPVAEESAHEQ